MAIDLIRLDRQAERERETMNCKEVFVSLVLDNRTRSRSRLQQIRIGRLSRTIYSAPTRPMLLSAGSV